MTQNFPKLSTMTEVRKNSTETTTFSKLSARKMSKLKISAKANMPKRRFRSQKICDAKIEVSAEAEVPLPLLRKLQNLSQCDRALTSGFKLMIEAKCPGYMGGSYNLIPQILG